MKLTIDEQIKIKREDKKGAILCLEGYLENVADQHERYQRNMAENISEDYLLSPVYGTGTANLINAIDDVNAQRIIIYGIEREIAALENCKRHMA